MRALLITVGSRGDNEPFVSLAQVLANKGHDVDLWLQQDQQFLAPLSPKISLHTLPFTTQDFYKYVGNPKPEHDHSNPRVKFTGIICDICANLVLPCYDEVLDSCNENKPNAIVASSLARHLGMVIATKLSVPICLIQLQPLVPTRDFPHSSNTKDIVNALVYDEGANTEENLETYLELERFQYKFMKEKWEQVYSEMKIPFPTVDDMLAILQGKNENVVMVNACSNQLIPDCTDHLLDDNVWNVGPLADGYLPENYEPPQALVNFLNASDQKPICIGYGSMPFEKTDMICNALKETKERAVLVGSAMMNVDTTNDSIFTIESVPYAYVLPHCSMMLSHGGAGVVNATLRAGVPSVISPLMGDQFFHAELLQAKGLGVVAGSLPELTVNTLVESIEKAKECSDACSELGTAIREQEAGSKRMVKLLEEKVHS